MSQPKMAAGSMIRSSVMPASTAAPQKLERISPWPPARGCRARASPAWPRSPSALRPPLSACSQAVGVEAVQIPVPGELEGELLAGLQGSQWVGGLQLGDEVEIAGAEGRGRWKMTCMLSPRRTFTCLRHSSGFGGVTGSARASRALCRPAARRPARCCHLSSTRVATACSLGQAASIMIMMLRISTILRCQVGRELKACQRTMRSRRS